MNTNERIFTGNLQRSQIPRKDDGAGHIRQFRRSAVQRQQLFSSSSKMPSIYTAGPICRVLGVSIDAFFHIQPTPDPSIEAQLAHEQEMNQLRVRAIRHKNYLILGLMILLAIALAYGITIDMLNPNIGLFQK